MVGVGWGRRIRVFLTKVLVTDGHGWSHLVTLDTLADVDPILARDETEAIPFVTASSEKKSFCLASSTP